MGLINHKLFVAALISLAAGSFLHTDAATLYVSPTGGQVPPYANWATAARVIQDAVDASVDGDEIVVTNGTYLTGGRPVGTNIFVNRVAVDRQITVRSVNGPQFTVIDGLKSIRCVSLVSNAMLFGFTLTNGLVSNSGAGVWCETLTAVVSNCILSGNVASNNLGGGSYGGTLINCTLTGNTSSYGGGSCYGTLINCIVWSNSANLGGGVYGCTLSNCAVTRNSAQSGGGSYSGTLNNCTLTGNSAVLGGGAYGGTLANCIVYYNLGPGGNYDSTAILNFCCTTPLPAVGTNNTSVEPQLVSAWHLSVNSPCAGKGSYDSVSAVDLDGEAWANPPSLGCDEYWSGSATGALSAAMAVSYTTVAVGYPVSFVAAISGLASVSIWDFGDGVVVSNRPYASHSWAAAGNYSVVLRAFNQSYPGGVAITNTVQVVTQPVHYVVTSGSAPSAPYSSWGSAATNIQTAVDAATVPGALILVSNGVYQTGIRTVSGMSNRVAVTKPVTVRSANGPAVTKIVGKWAPNTNGSTAIRCVYLTNGAMLAGFTLTNGATQTTGDQNRQMSGGAVFCEMGGSVVSNCVLTGNSASSRGGAACFGTLLNCTIAGNAANSGGGAYSCTLKQCVVRGNSASYGGGAYYGTLDSCTLTNNSAVSGGAAYFATLNGCALTSNSVSAYAPYGGAAYFCTLDNCTIAGNSAAGTWPYGGGAYSGTANNSILFFNTASNGPNYHLPGPSTLNYCCTTPDPGGAGNITSAPLFMDYGAGNLRLQSNSPCINGGNNADVFAPMDLDSNPRLMGGTVDIGAYEFQGAGSVIPYSWLQQYGLPTDGSADFSDSDQDGVNNWQEWVAGTNPINASSVLRISSATSTDNPVGYVVTWDSQSTRMYYLQRSGNLAQPGFTTVQDNIAGQLGTTSYTDTNTFGPGPFFYRVGVRVP